LENRRNAKLIKLPDAICRDCVNASVCRGACPLIKWVNGKEKRKEPLARPDIVQSLPQSDYNSTLYEMMIDQDYRDSERIEIIRQISNWRRRAIFSMSLALIPQTEIAKLMHLSQQHISRIFKGK
jgi:hypothetical protein